MFALYLILMMLCGYLFGSISWAVVITKIISGKDIRQIGNQNAGTANVGRSIGKAWGTVVFLLDLAKGAGPMLLGRWLFFSGYGYSDYLALFIIGIAAIFGHCRPIFFRFKGGRGAATSIAVYFFFIPVEIMISLILSFIAVNIFFRKSEYRIGRWTSVLFVLMVPFLNLALNYIFSIPLYGNVTFGGHPWYILVGVFATSIALLLINYPFLKLLFVKSSSET